MASEKTRHFIPVEQLVKILSDGSALLKLREWYSFHHEMNSVSGELTSLSNGIATDHVPHGREIYGVRNKAGEPVAGFLVDNDELKRITFFVAPGSKRHEINATLLTLEPFLKEAAIDDAFVNKALLRVKGISGQYYNIANLPDGFTHPGDFTVPESDINGNPIVLPRNLKVLGDLYYRTEIRANSLPENLFVAGSVTLQGDFKLSSGTRIEGDFDHFACYDVDNRYDRTFHDPGFRFEVGGGFTLRTYNLESLPDEILNREELTIDTNCPFARIHAHRRQYTRLVVHATVLNERMPEGISASNRLSLSFANGDALPQQITSLSATTLDCVRGAPSLRNWNLGGELNLSKCELEDLPENLTLYSLNLYGTSIQRMPKIISLYAFSMVDDCNIGTLDTILNFREGENRIELNRSTLKFFPDGSLKNFTGTISIESQNFLPRLPDELKDQDVEIEINQIAGKYSWYKPDWDGYNEIREKLNDRQDVC